MFAFIFAFRNFVLANCHLPAIIWCFASPTGWRLTKDWRFCVSSAISRPRFRGSTVFRRGQPSGEMQGSRFCWCGAAQPRRCQQKVLTAALRGCSGSSLR